MNETPSWVVPLLFAICTLALAVSGLMFARLKNAKDLGVERGTLVAELKGIQDKLEALRCDMKVKFEELKTNHDERFRSVEKEIHILERRIEKVSSRITVIDDRLNEDKEERK
jgi:peptidoglycan hydrolase CwlO-like protein